LGVSCLYSSRFNLGIRNGLEAPSKYDHSSITKQLSGNSNNFERLEYVFSWMRPSTLVFSD